MALTENNFVRTIITNKNEENIITKIHRIFKPVNSLLNISF